MSLRKPLRTTNIHRKKLWVRSAIALFILFVITYSVQVVVTFIGQSPPSSRLNYFLEGDEHLKLGYIVNTPTCRILNISAWDKTILPFLSNQSQRSDCDKNRAWTYTNETNLIINVTALYESGYSLNSVECCYKTIERVHQSPDRYNEYADLQIIYGKTCKPLTRVINQINDEFIRVICTSKYWPWTQDVVYRNFHAIPLPNRSSKTVKKIKYWNEEEKKEVPPNVLLLGIDSMSRLSFQRNMKQTRSFLQEIGAVEMLGYTKVGENTFPNAIAFNTGYPASDISKICFFSQNTRLDLCPFLWKKYSESNYLTAFIEDVPLLATFNYFKTGFVQQPTDYYFRPFMLGVHYHSPSILFSLDCIGPKTVDQTIHKYVSDLISLSSKNNTPAFIYTWLTNLAHGDLNAAQFADDYYLNFLQSLDLSNTILFFMSDHGYRYGMIRETFAGWQEDKLPNFWVYLPKKVQKKFPEWLPSVQRNSVRLTNPFDLYKTLVHILQTFNKVPEIKPSKSYLGEVIPRKFGQTLFQDVPVRKCPEAGISENLCACVAPRKLPTNNSNIIAAAKKAIKNINKQLPKVCEKLALNKITAGGIMDDDYEGGGDKDNSTVTYVVAFETIPGEFLFEATVERNKSIFTVVGELLRMNKIKTDVSCVKNDFLEKICFCEPT